ncbi:DoxX-like protein [Larkinella arboricola]|uniref:DoxX-like protein n=1 Tax=Larkinella arboricola TaxID=643671 RepID=A0A327X9I8_LARAB|nr:DoxX family protein [Larkinella arboricola]RAK02754.1 DoxX-like protein [Larkinella arboricola]
MDIFVWVLQISLALFFMAPALMKIKTPKREMIEKQQLAPGESILPIRALGVIEVLGSIGIILPLWLGILPVLTPLAATGFCVVMVGATIVHYKKGDYKVLPLLVVVFIAAAFVAWSRFQSLPA